MGEREREEERGERESAWEETGAKTQKVAMVAIDTVSGPQPTLGNLPGCLTASTMVYPSVTLTLFSPLRSRNLSSGHAYPDVVDTAG